MPAGSRLLRRVTRPAPSAIRALGLERWLLANRALLGLERWLTNRALLGLERWLAMGLGLGLPDELLRARRGESRLGWDETHRVQETALGPGASQTGIALLRAASA